ncbi:MAG: hypothetical protein H6Q67_387 [Firmicutes bacterium]|nr:hypothetical protein [Bacillota bacterium]
MGKDLDGLNIGAVTVLTAAHIVYQGTIQKMEENRGSDDPDFILLQLVCYPGIVRDNAQLKVISPFLYNIGAIIRINVEEIVSIGPSTGICPSDG